MSFKAERNTNAIFFFIVFAAVVAFVLYWRVGGEENPGDYNVRKGNYRLEDGQYEEAVAEFSKALQENPDHVFANLGLAVSYMQMGKNEDAIKKFDTVIALDPNLAVAYADKGILLDRLGNYEAALANYKKAIELDAEILEGPGWLWRFLRNVDEMPPTIQDRAAYLEEELKKPPEERLLAVPEKDAEQRMYKVE